MRANRFAIANFFIELLSVRDTSAAIRIIGDIFIGCRVFVFLNDYGDFSTYRVITEQACLVESEPVCEEPRVLD
jgi:hypothetical protein